jgi:hypothetical protein
MKLREPQEALGKLTPDHEMSCSLVSALWHENPYQNLNEVLENCHKALKGQNIRSEANLLMEVGNIIEKPLIALAAKRIGLLDYFDEIHKPVRHRHIALNGSIDAIGVADGIDVVTDPDKSFYVPEGDSVRLEGKGILEIKATGARPENPPANHRGVLQLKALLATTQYNWGAVCIAYGTDYRIFFYQRDEQWEKEELEPKVKDFDSRIADCRYFDPFNTNQANHAFPLDDGSIVDLPDDALNSIENILLQEKTIKAAQTIIDEHKTKLMNAMQSAQIGRMGKYQVNWKTINYKAKPEQTKIIPAKDAYTQRRFSIKVHDES